jgi:hypothetical protein
MAGDRRPTRPLAHEAKLLGAHFFGLLRGKKEKEKGRNFGLPSVPECPLKLGQNFELRLIMSRRSGAGDRRPASDVIAVPAKNS